MTRLFLLILDIIFPCRCVSCGKIVLHSMNHLCGDCRNLLIELEDGCPVCSGIVIDGDCSICSDRMFYPAKSISLFRYEKISRELVHSLKFGGLKHIHRIFVPYICERIKDFDEKIDLITCVPMNRRKLARRGYNQSRLLAEGVSRKTGIKFHEILKEKRNKTKQRDLNYSERFINVIDRYESVNNIIFRNKVILLIDDVFTTGATINECSRKLINSGADKVFSLTVVRSDLKKLENI